MKKLLKKLWEWRERREQREYEAFLASPASLITAGSTYYAQTTWRVTDGDKVLIEGTGEPPDWYKTALEGKQGKIRLEGGRTIYGGDWPEVIGENE